MKTRHQELREACIAFHKAHPIGWALFVKFTFERIGLGFEHYSVNAIFERIRWETDQANVDGKTSFKLNNNYRPFYARRFHRMYPEHDGFFRLRHQISKEGPAVQRNQLGPQDFPYDAR